MQPRPEARMPVIGYMAPSVTRPGSADSGPVRGGDMALMTSHGTAEIDSYADYVMHGNVPEMSFPSSYPGTPMPHRGINYSMPPSGDSIRGPPDVSGGRGTEMQLNSFPRSYPATPMFHGGLNYSMPRPGDSIRGPPGVSGGRGPEIFVNSFPRSYPATPMVHGGMNYSMPPPGDSVRGPAEVSGGRGTEMPVNSFPRSYPATPMFHGGMNYSIPPPGDSVRGPAEVSGSRGTETFVNSYSGSYPTTPRFHEGRASAQGLGGFSGRRDPEMFANSFASSYPATPMFHGGMNSYMRGPLRGPASAARSSPSLARNETPTTTYLRPPGFTPDQSVYNTHMIQMAFNHPYAAPGAPMGLAGSFRSCGTCGFLNSSNFPSCTLCGSTFPGTVNVQAMPHVQTPRPLSARTEPRPAPRAAAPGSMRSTKPSVKPVSKRRAKGRSVSGDAGADSDDEEFEIQGPALPAASNVERPRRSGRQTRKTVSYDLKEEEEEEEDAEKVDLKSLTRVEGGVSATDEEEAVVTVERIIARRKLVIEPNFVPHKDDDGYEYLVKHHGVSYLHVHWIRASALAEQGWQRKQSLNKDRSRLSQLPDGNYLVNIDNLLEVDSILSVGKVLLEIDKMAFLNGWRIVKPGDPRPVGKELVEEEIMLVKWTGQSYGMASWERLSDLGDRATSKLARYHEINKVPTLQVAAAAAVPRHTGLAGNSTVDVNLQLIVASKLHWVRGPGVVMYALSIVRGVSYISSKRSDGTVTSRVMNGWPSLPWRQALEQALIHGGLTLEAISSAAGMKLADLKLWLRGRLEGEAVHMQTLLQDWLKREFPLVFEHAVAAPITSVNSAAIFTPLVLDPLEARRLGELEEAPEDLASITPVSSCVQCHGRGIGKAVCRGEMKHSGFDWDLASVLQKTELHTPYGVGSFLSLVREGTVMLQLPYGIGYFNADAIRIERHLRMETEGVVSMLSTISGANSRPYEGSPAFKGGNELRDYQVDGLNWLMRQWHQRRHSILADEMGLGKTVQVVTMLNHLCKVQKIRGPFLVVAPLSTIQHWRREVETWTDMVPCVYHDEGGREMRELIREHEWFFSDQAGLAGVATKELLKFNVLITTYEVVVSDVEFLAEYRWPYVVIDEAHRLRSNKSQLQKSLSLIDVSYKLLLTGTPLQNDLKELWAILNFVEAAPSLPEFMARFGDLKTQEQLRELQDMMAPFVLRRVKEDVEKRIPVMEETIIDVELTMLQKQYYRAIFEKNRSFLYQGCEKAGMPSLVNIEMQLRKCCNHPFLIAGVEGKVLGTEIANYNDPEQLRLMVQSSGKLVLVDKLLPKLKAEGHKVLIFSQMVKMLDVLEDYLSASHIGYERLDGSVHGADRQAAIDRFCSKGSLTQVFLLSTRAGGVGINLTAADTVIIFDNDWNPQNDNQATARCHRIGQTQQVKVYRLITRNTYEASMFERASKKLGLETAIFGTGGLEGSGVGMGGRKNGVTVSKQELERLLRTGAYNLLHDDESESKVFCDADIDSILATKTRTVRLERAEQRGGAFSTATKQTFAADQSSIGIDVNDPDFWLKVLPQGEASASRIQARLSDGSACESVQSRATFLKDLSQLVRTIATARQDGEDVPMLELETVVDVLTRASLMTTAFTEEQRGDLSCWILDIEKSQQRRCRTQGGRSMGGYEEDDHEGRAEWNGTRANSRSAKGTAKPVKATKTRTRLSVKSKRKSRSHALSITDRADWNDALCAMCLEGGDLLICDGQCKRSFHLQCLGMSDTAPRGTWECPACMSKTHACALCGKAGVLDEADEGVFKCSIASCGKFYHVDCLSKNELTNWLGTDDQIKFRCPSHYCYACHRPGDSKSSVLCFKCPKAFHPTCLPIDSIFRRTRRLLLCSDHASPEEIASLRDDLDARTQQEFTQRLLAVSGQAGSVDVTPLRDSPSRSLSSVYKCAFCHVTGDCPTQVQGRFLPRQFPIVFPGAVPGEESKELVSVHENCARTAPLVIFSEEDHQYTGVGNAVKRSRLLRCSGESCKTRGATIACKFKGCKLVYHYRCSLETGWNFNEGEEFTCIKHSPKTTREERMELAKVKRRARALMCVCRKLVPDEADLVGCVACAQCVRRFHSSCTPQIATVRKDNAGHQVVERCTVCYLGCYCSCIEAPSPEKLLATCSGCRETFHNTCQPLVSMPVEGEINTVGLAFDDESSMVGSELSSLAAGQAGKIASTRLLCRGCLQMLPWSKAIGSKRKRGEDKANVVKRPKLEPKRHKRIHSTTCSVCMTARMNVVECRGVLGHQLPDWFHPSLQNPNCCAICNCSNSGKALLRCGSCQVNVHKSCYGLAEDALDCWPGWLCEPCAAGQVGVSCSLCPMPGGALKPTDVEGAWAHIICVLWTPSLSFGSPSEFKPVLGIDSLDKTLLDGECAFCGIDNVGVHINCSVPGCLLRFHASCGQKATLSRAPTPDSIVKAYCPDHCGTAGLARSVGPDSCAKCGKDDRPHQILLCDSNCGREFHMDCLEPPLLHVPEGSWHCEFCRVLEEKSKNTILW